MFRKIKVESKLYGAPGVKQLAVKRRQILWQHWRFLSEYTQIVKEKTLISTPRFLSGGEEYTDHFLASYGPGGVARTLTSWDMGVHLDAASNQMSRVSLSLLQAPVTQLNEVILLHCGATPRRTFPSKVITRHLFSSVWFSKVEPLQGIKCT